MKVKEILNLEVEELEKMMTEEDHEKMKKLNLESWQLLDALQDSARLSGQDDDEEHVSITDYLDYLEDMQNQ